MQKTTLNQLSSFSIRSRLTWLLIRETETYSSSLMRFFYFLWFDEISSQQGSRVILIKLDESLSSSLMSRSQFDEMRLSKSFLSRSQMMNRSQFDEMRLLESSHQRHIRRLTNREQTYVIRWIEARHSKQWRWDDQTRSRERIVTNNFCMRKSVSYFSDHISHRDKTQNTLSTYSRSKSSHQYSSQ